jgi:hypothetical protein
MIGTFLCPKSNQPCRHASLIYIVNKIPKTKTIKSILGPQVVPDGYDRSIKENGKGLWCGNDGQHYISELSQCPNRSGGITSLSLDKGPVERTIPAKTKQVSLSCQ